MRMVVAVLVLVSTAWVVAQENLVCDDGTGAQITYCLPVRGEDHGQPVDYGSFRISAERNGKFLLLADLPGKIGTGGSNFVGKIIIPSDLVAVAEIIAFGAPPNSSRGVEKRIKVSELKRVSRAKSWTESK